MLLLAGCADGGGEDGGAHARLNGVYTTFGGAALHR